MFGIHICVPSISKHVMLDMSKCLFSCQCFIFSFSRFGCFYSSSLVTASRMTDGGVQTNTALILDAVKHFSCFLLSGSRNTEMAWFPLVTLRHVYMCKKMTLFFYFIRDGGGGELKTLWPSPWSDPSRQRPQEERLQLLFNQWTKQTTDHCFMLFFFGLTTQVIQTLTPH